MSRAMARRRQEDQTDDALEGMERMFTPGPSEALEGREEREMESGEAGPTLGRAEEREGPGAEMMAAPAVTEGQTRLSLSREGLIRAQREDPELATLWEKALTEEEAAGEASCIYVERGLLRRKWRDPQLPSEEYNTIR